MKGDTPQIDDKSKADTPRGLTSCTKMHNKVDKLTEVRSRESCQKSSQIVNFHLPNQSKRCNQGEHHNKG